MTAPSFGYRLWHRLILAELHRLRTDVFLNLILVLMPLQAPLVNTLWPLLVARWPGWPLAEAAPYVSALLSLLTPLMMGLVLGFHCLAEREAGLLAAIRLTPAGLGRTLGIRLAGYSLAGWLMTLVVHQWLGLVSLSWIEAWAVSTLALPLLPFATLLLLAFANNQVEGFALMKATGGLVSIPLLALALAPPPWPWLAAPLPTWWTLLGYVRLAADDPVGWVWMALGSMVLLAGCALMFHRISHRSN